MSNNTKRPCIYGHDITKYNRKDGTCGGCHAERNIRYMKTPKGRLMNLRREEKRRANPERIYYRIKWLLQTQIETKREKIAELERILS